MDQRNSAAQLALNRVLHCGRSSRQDSFRLAFALALTALFLSSDSSIALTLHYETRNADSGAIVTKSSRVIRRVSPSTFEVVLLWASPADSSSGEQRYLVDDDFATLEWTVERPDTKTNYTGRREGNVLTITGTLDGAVVEKRIEIDERPFHNNPSFGLEGFVRSGEKEAEFRTLRPDNLSDYKMKARVKERDVINIGGQEVTAVRVEWGLTGFKSMFFKRNLWFRESDGRFLRSEVADGEYSELVRSVPDESDSAP